MTYNLLITALLGGILLGGFYAAVSIGLQVSFGLLDVPNVAHPTFLLLGGYGAYVAGSFGLDPLLAGLLLTPLFYVLGSVTYRFFFLVFEQRSAEDRDLRTLAFFFGIAFVAEILLVQAFGVDQRMVEAHYIGVGVDVLGLRMPLRMLVAFAVAVAVTLTLTLYLSRTFRGRAIRAVSQSEEGLSLVGAQPVAIKRHAFAISIAMAAVTGALLIVIGPIEPGLGRVYLGKMFSIVVLGGLGSIEGTLIAGMVLGIAESVVLSSFGSSWAPAVAFGTLLFVLAVRPAGLFGRTI